MSRSRLCRLARAEASVRPSPVIARIICEAGSLNGDESIIDRIDALIGIIDLADQSGDLILADKGPGQVP
jgi:hypothetical protein